MTANPRERSGRWSPLAWVRLSRPRDWCTSKLPFVVACALWLNPGERSILVFFAIAATIAALAAFGYGLNDVADRSADARAEKPNRAAAASPLEWGTFLVATAVVSLALVLVWAPDRAAPILLVGVLALSAAYSARPLRLKERGFIGVVAAAAAQWALPVLLVSAATAEGALRPGAWLLSALGLAIGIRWICVHQLRDRPFDREAHVRTYATEGGRMGAAIERAFRFELAAIAIALIATWPHGAAPAVALAVWLAKTQLASRRCERFAEALRSYELAPLADYYFLLLPLSLALARGSSDPRFLLLVPAFLVLGGGQLLRIVEELRTARRRASA